MYMQQYIGNNIYIEENSRQHCVTVNDDTFLKFTNAQKQGAIDIQHRCKQGEQNVKGY